MSEQRLEVERTGAKRRERYNVMRKATDSSESALTKDRLMIGNTDDGSVSLMMGLLSSTSPPTERVSGLGLERRTEAMGEM